MLLKYSIISIAFFNKGYYKVLLLLINGRIRITVAQLYFILKCRFAYVYIYT